MNIVRIDLGSDVETVNLYPLADIHAGSAHFHSGEFEDYVSEIDKDPNAVVILNGDLINNAVRHGVSDIYEDTLNPQESIDYVYDVLLPIRDKIIGVVPGNHENRTYKATGIDVVRNLSERLGVIQYYDHVANLIFLSFGKSRSRDNVRNTFSIYHTHGSGGGRTTGGKANKLGRMSDIVQCDVYIHSHTHMPISFKQDFFLASNSNKGISRVSQLYVNTNAYEGYGGYGEAAGYPPSNTEYVTVKLSYDQRGNKYKKAVI